MESNLIYVTLIRLVHTQNEKQWSNLGQSETVRSTFWEKLCQNTNTHECANTIGEGATAWDIKYRKITWS